MKNWGKQETGRHSGFEPRLRLRHHRGQLELSAPFRPVQESWARCPLELTPPGDLERLFVAVATESGVDRNHQEDWDQQQGGKA